MSIKQKIYGIANRLGGMPDLMRVRTYLIIYAWMFLMGTILTIAYSFSKDWLRVGVFSLMVAGSLLAFIGQSVLYKKLNFLQQFRADIKEVKHA